MRNTEGFLGVSTGFVALDEMLGGGFRNSDFVIIAARHSMGKTAFSLNIAHKAAVKNGIPVVFFSVEMAAIQLRALLLGAEARHNAYCILTGRIG